MRKERNITIKLIQNNKKQNKKLLVELFAKMYTEKYIKQKS